VFRLPCSFIVAIILSRTTNICATRLLYYYYYYYFVPLPIQYTPFRFEFLHLCTDKSFVHPYRCKSVQVHRVLFRRCTHNNTFYTRFTTICVLLYTVYTIKICLKCNIEIPSKVLLDVCHTIIYYNVYVSWITVIK